MLKSGTVLIRFWVDCRRRLLWQRSGSGRDHMMNAATWLQVVTLSEFSLLLGQRCTGSEKLKSRLNRLLLPNGQNVPTSHKHQRTLPAVQFTVKIHSRHRERRIRHTLYGLQTPLPIHLEEREHKGWFRLFLPLLLSVNTSPFVSNSCDAHQTSAQDKAGSTALFRFP